MKKCLFILGLTVLTSGCALFTKPPSKAAERQFEAGKAETERAAAISARASYYEKQGYSHKEALGFAATEYRATGRP